MTTCRSCGKPAPRRICNDCKRFIDRNFYKQNAPEKSASAQKRKRELLDWYRAQKDMKPCVRCGHAWPAAAMQFDHVRGKKFMDVSRMVRLGYLKEKIEAEIAKTQILCACCHALVTVERRQNGKKLA